MGYLMTPSLLFKYSSIKKFHPLFLQEAFLGARCHPVFYGNYFIKCISWRVIILLLSQKMFYCCWQTRFHTYLSWPLWWSLSLPHWHIFSLRGSDSLFTLSGCLILCDIPSFCLCWWVFWEMGLLRWPLLLECFFPSLESSCLCISQQWMHHSHIWNIKIRHRITKYSKLEGLLSPTLRWMSIQGWNPEPWNYWHHALSSWANALSVFPSPQSSVTFISSLCKEGALTPLFQVLKTDVWCNCLWASGVE